MKITPDTKITNNIDDSKAVIKELGLLMFKREEIVNTFINSERGMRDNRYDEGFKTVISGTINNLFIGMITSDNRPVASSNVFFESHADALIERVKHAPVKMNEIRTMLKDYHSLVAKATHLPEIIQDMYLKSGPKLETMIGHLGNVMEVFSVTHTEHSHVVQLGFKSALFARPEVAEHMAGLFGENKTVRITLTIYHPDAEPVL